jgi:hypothetical protein
MLNEDEFLERTVLELLDVAEERRVIIERLKATMIEKGIWEE